MTVAAAAATGRDIDSTGGESRFRDCINLNWVKRHPSYKLQGTRRGRISNYSSEEAASGDGRHQLETCPRPIMIQGKSGLKHP